MNQRRFFAALLGLLTAVSAVGFPPVAVAAAPGPLPACVYDDVLTARREYTDWSKSLLDTRLKLGKGYAPPHLVSVSEAGIAGRGRVRPLVIEDLRALQLAAREAGNPIEVNSAYRSFKRQKELFGFWVERYGMTEALATSARAGHSEHQLGTTLDFKAKGGPSPWASDDWATTPAGAWLKQKAWRFGFVMSYPKGKRLATCYGYEPWHYRYFGREIARAIHFSGLTTRQWLWRQGYGRR